MKDSDSTPWLNVGATASNVSRQRVMLIVKRALPYGGHYSPPDARLSCQPQNITALFMPRRQRHSVFRLSVHACVRP